MDHIDNNPFHSSEFQIPNIEAGDDSVMDQVETNITVEEDNTGAEQVDVRVVPHEMGRKAFQAVEVDGFNSPRRRFTTDSLDPHEAEVHQGDYIDF